MAVFRVYTSDDSFTKVDIPANGVSEFQVVLTFARDRDGEDITNGKFIPCWDTTRVTPEVINNFKTRFPSAKVLVSIGNDHRRFPFQIDESNEPAWIQAAKESLTRIIQKYNLDGLDVYYQDFAVIPGNFISRVGKVIEKLKGDNVITRASISPNIDHYDQFYWPLFQTYQNNIDLVVFQYFTSAVEGANNPGDHRALLEKFRDNIPPQKSLLGYTGISEDWPSALFPPPLFFVIIFERLRDGSIKGASIKVTRWSITNFSPQWLLDVLTSPWILPIAPLLQRTN